MAARQRPQSAAPGGRRKFRRTKRGINVHNATQARKVAQKQASGEDEDEGGSKSVWSFLAKKSIDAGEAETAKDEAKRGERQTEWMAGAGEVRTHSQPCSVSTTVVLFSLTVYRTTGDSETGDAGHQDSLTR